MLKRLMLTVVALCAGTTVLCAYGRVDGYVKAHQEKLTIYVVRHGQTIFNMMDRVQGISDGILTEKGIQGAIDMGKGLRTVPFTAVYSSDLGRARETARLAMEQNNATVRWTVKEMPELREVSFGIFEGDPNPEMYIALAKDLGIPIPEDGSLGPIYGALIERLGGTQGFLEGLADFNKKIDTVYRIAESSGDVYERLRKGLNTIISENPNGGNVMIVAHGQSIGFLFSLINVKMPDGGGLANSSVTKILYDYTDKTFIVDGPVGDMSYAEAGAKIN
ncbi:MAG: histidine phosphatase family protein [Treponema sp.]|jgi:probable phosphoglycerate mutase|nr:histidine phosphatase family protein [Treponema sp.]